MTKSFKKIQYDHQCDVCKEHPDWFGYDKCFGTFRKKTYSFVLKSCMNNLFEELRTKDKENPMNVLRYFRENGIGWWSGAKPSGHMCSSQISCINHLFPLRYDRKAVLTLANSVAGDNPFDDVLEVGGDKSMPGYIAFEVVTSKDYLNEAREGNLSRGSQCTSVDAAILAKRNDDVVVIPIEWKFVEEYNRDDKSKNIFDKKEKVWHYSGDKRIENYFSSGLVPNSKQIVFNDEQAIKGSVFFQEPFYQLMRQTLWAEQVVLNKDEYFHGASDYIHVHVVPEANTTLRNKAYKEVWDKGEGMVSTWKDNLTNPDKYVCIDQQKLFSGIVNDKDLSSQYAALLKYLKERYW